MDAFTTNLTSASASSASAIDTSTVDDASMWTTEHPFAAGAGAGTAAGGASKLYLGLQTMEEQLRCNCCREFMTVPVSLVLCHHSFCKQCLCDYAKTSMRSHKRKINCPTCRIEIPADFLNKQMIPNDTVAELIYQYKNIRNELKENLALAVLIRQQQQQQQQPNEDSRAGDASEETKAEEENNNSTSSSISAPSANTRGRKRERCNYAGMDDGNDDTMCDYGDTEGAYMEVYQDTSNENYDPKQQYGTNDDFNIHSTTAIANAAVSVSRCGSFSSTTTHQQKKQRVLYKPKPKSSYGTLKKKQLQDLCHKEGLPTHGTPKELQERHDAFISAYNAECDSIRPRSIQELREFVLQQERSRKQQAQRYQKDSECLEQLKKNSQMQTKNTKNKAGLVKSGNEDFDTKLQSNFKVMIEQLRARKQQQQQKDKSKKPRLEFDQDGDSGNNCTTQAAVTIQTPPATHNPYKKTPSSTTTAVNNNDNSSVGAFPSFTLSDTVRTPAAAALDVFAPGFEVPPPSTNGHKQSQTFYSYNNKNADFELIPQSRDAAFSPNQHDKDPVAQAAAATASSVTTGSNESTQRKQTEQKVLNVERSKITNNTTTTSARCVSRRRRSGGGGSSRTGVWTCCACTFENTKQTWSTAACDMCNTPRFAAEERSALVSDSANPEEATVSL